MRDAESPKPPTKPVPLRLLLIDHNRDDTVACLDAIRNAGIAASADAIGSPQEFAERVRAAEYDLVLAPNHLPEWALTDAIPLLQHLGLNIPVILVAGNLGRECEVDRFWPGASDEIKAELVALPIVIRRVLEKRALREERVTAGAALQDSEARYRSLVENAIYGIYRATLEGELLDVNPALVTMLGYESKNELLKAQKTQKLYQEPEVREQLTKQVQRTGRADGEIVWKKKDGRSITVRLTGRRVRDESRSIDCFEIFVEDVTERRSLERQLQQKDKMEAVGRLAGGIAHDFNNMIGAILGWAELGMETTPAEDRRHSHFGKIQQQAERAAALTRQLLAFARRRIFEPRNMDLNPAVREALDLLEKMIGSDIEVKTILAPDLGMIRSDPTQIEQVLMNLCLNARDAMPQGGRLVIETQNVEFSEEECRCQTDPLPGRYAQLAVTDNGTGMDATTLERIFEPFFTTKGVGKGTGLGLATVYGIVKQRDGFIHVDSKPGQGTTFRIYLPVSPVAEELPAKAQLERAISGGAETILVAEDHDGMRELVHEVLSGLGYQVLLAKDGEAAVRLYEENHDRVDLVLLDMVMPKLNGPEVYSHLRARRADVRVVFATGYSAEGTRIDELKQEGALVLQKPYTKKALARCVREALDQRKLHPSYVRTG